MKDTFIIISSGLMLGLVAGISPGPLLSLVISETLKYGKKEGLKLAMVPIITDLPIIFLSIFTISRIVGFNSLLGVISLLGAIFIFYLAFENIMYNKKQLNINTRSIQSVQKGIITNFLSPHPYLFWILIGGPMIIKAYGHSIFTAVMFVISFYAPLIGSKITVAILTAKFKNIVNKKAYKYLIRLMGIALFLFAIFLLRDAVNYFTTK